MQHLYKYVGDYSVSKFIASGQIKFTTIEKLNDPSELTSNVINQKVVESLHRLRKDGYTEDDLLYLRRQEAVFRRLAPKHQVILAPTRVVDANMLIHSPIYNQIDILEQRLSDTVKEISKKVGVFCLSKGFDSLPMWAHYAGNAKGFVVEYSRLNEFFSGDETGVLWNPTEVRYERGETGGVTFEPKSHDAIFFEKFEDWKYEREVRVVAPLDRCVPVTTKAKGLIYTFDIPPRHVTRLILGWNIGEREADDVRQAAKVFGCRVDQARFDGGTIKIY